MDEDQAKFATEFLLTYLFLSFIVSTVILSVVVYRLQRELTDLNFRLEEAVTYLDTVDEPYVPTEPFSGTVPLAEAQYAHFAFYSMAATTQNSEAEAQTLTQAQAQAIMVQRILGPDDSGELGRVRGNGRGHGHGSTTTSAIKQKIRNGITTVRVQITEAVKTSGTALVTSGRAIGEAAVKRFNKIKILVHGRGKERDKKTELPVTQMREWQVLANGAGGVRQHHDRGDMSMSICESESETTLIIDGAMEKPQGLATVVVKPLNPYAE
ncbi:hypothetical protein BD289DRAFT_473779 [Coniella lustricola]|uniref:Uncharacterized protein n=1 Tax=Coniella lustricola TaxID=2025994 RepID=A0A2T3AA10_9PEZI|nr:hypothetical protein BD289DRAFT_473779 [Coniella lustricola]